MFEAGAGNAHFHLAVGWVEFTGVREDVHQDLLVFGHVAPKLGVTEAILLVDDRYFYILFSAEQFDYLSDGLSSLL